MDKLKRIIFWIQVFLLYVISLLTQIFLLTFCAVLGIILYLGAWSLISFTKDFENTLFGLQNIVFSNNIKFALVSSILGSQFSMILCHAENEEKINGKFIFLIFATIFSAMISISFAFQDLKNITLSKCASSIVLLIMIGLFMICAFHHSRYKKSYEQYREEYLAKLAAKKAKKDENGSKNIDGFTL